MLRRSGRAPPVKARNPGPGAAPTSRTGQIQPRPFDRRRLGIRRISPDSARIGARNSPYSDIDGQMAVSFHEPLRFSRLPGHRSGERPSQRSAVEACPCQEAPAQGHRVNAGARRCTARPAASDRFSGAPLYPAGTAAAVATSALIPRPPGHDVQRWRSKYLRPDQQRPRARYQRASRGSICAAPDPGEGSEFGRLDAAIRPRRSTGGGSESPGLGLIAPRSRLEIRPTATLTADWPCHSTTDRARARAVTRTGQQATRRTTGHVAVSSVHLGEVMQLKLMATGNIRKGQPQTAGLGQASSWSNATEACR